MKEIKSEVVGGEKVIVEKIKNERGSIFDPDTRASLIQRVLSPTKIGNKYELGPEFGPEAARELGLKDLFRSIHVHAENQVSGNVQDGSMTDVLLIYTGIKWSITGLHAVECARISLDESISQSCADNGGILDMRGGPKGDSAGATAQGQLISFHPLRNTFGNVIRTGDLMLTSYDERVAVVRRLAEYCRSTHSTLGLNYMPAIVFTWHGSFKGFYVPDINFMWVMDITHYREGVSALGQLLRKIEEIIGHPIQRLSKTEKEVKEEKKLTEDELREKIGEPDLSKVTLTLGCDQEFELLDGNGSVVLPNPNMFRNWNKSVIGLDGSQNVVEFRPAPGKTHRRLMTNIQKVMEKAKDMKLSTDGNHLPVGCHIHFGVGRIYYPHTDMLYLLDRFLTIPCYPINGTARGPESEACRYGRLSDFRVQPHGFEYRSLPASVMSDKRFFKIILQISRNIVQKWMALKDFEFSYKASEYELLPYDAYEKCCHISTADYGYFKEYIKNYKCELKNVVALWIDAVEETSEEVVGREVPIVDIPPSTAESLVPPSGGWSTYSNIGRDFGSFEINFVADAHVGSVTNGESRVVMDSVPSENPRQAREQAQVYVDRGGIPRVRATQPPRPSRPLQAECVPPEPAVLRSLARSGRGSLVTTTASLKNAYRNVELFMTYAGGDAQQWASEVRKHIRSTVFNELVSIVGKEKNVRVYLNIELSPMITEGRLRFSSIVAPTDDITSLSHLKTYKALEVYKVKILPCDPTSLVVVQTDKLPLRLIVGVPESFLNHSCDSNIIVTISEFIRDMVCWYTQRIITT